MVGLKNFNAAHLIHCNGALLSSLSLKTKQNIIILQCSLSPVPDCPSHYIKYCTSYSEIPFCLVSIAFRSKYINYEDDIDSRLVL